MTILRYAVLQVGKEWRVVCARRRIGHFRTRAQAVDAGAKLAREAVQSGHEVEFMVQDRTGFLVSQSFEPRRVRLDEGLGSPVGASLDAVLAARNPRGSSIGYAEAT